MSLRPFRIPETRLLAVNELVVQVTLTFRTDEDEELRYRYVQNKELQSLVQTAVVSLVNCGYTHGVAQGPGFILHQMRKKWPIGKRYIFTRYGEPLQSSLHKYFFQLELVDNDTDPEATPVLEVTELRGVALSPSVSSIAGSTIDGLDAVALPPMTAIFGAGAEPTHTYGQTGGAGGHRRSGSGYSAHSMRSVHSSYSAYSNYQPRSQSPSPYSRRLRDSIAADNGLAGNRLSSYRMSTAPSSSPRLRAHQPPADASIEREVLEEAYHGASQRAARSEAVAQYTQYYAPNHIQSQTAEEEHDVDDDVNLPAYQSPEQSTMRTRSISRTSIGSANGSVHTMQSISDVISAPAAKAMPIEGVRRNGDVSKPRTAHLANGSDDGTSPPINSQLRLGRTSWYRSLHGISPLSRQPKSLSSSDNEFVLGATADQQNPNSVAASSGGTKGSTVLAASRIPRIAGQHTHRLKDLPADPSGISGLASRLKRRILTPINLHRTRQRNSSLSREIQRAEAKGNSGMEDEVDTSDFTASEAEGVSENEAAPEADSALGSAIPIPTSALSRQRASEDRAKDDTPAVARINIQRPDMPPPSTIPPPRAQRQQPKDAAQYKSPAETTSIPTAVKNILLRRLRSPLGGRPDKSSLRSSVRDRIAAFNTLSVNGNGNNKEAIIAKHHEQQVTPPLSGEEKPASSTNNAPTEHTRTRIGTSTGFISMASPASTSGVARPQSRANSVISLNARAASPALSQMSNVSVRIQEAISSLERATGSAIETTTPRGQSVSGATGLSGTKRSATSIYASDALDQLTTPTKRPRAPSATTYGAAGSAAGAPTGSSRLNPLNMVQRMVRRHTGR
ncbi:hypothetical protein GGI25_001724 [Coemansia spiralis]|uniref:Uncharacterized protein n=2 Tax=Coemansia TaxID=4863 RepID=A0A9W8GC06_9FUNG|nr:hypothetical protein BX070DRAFT_221160 [Coemansia spiralis]KAJ1991406.1 hypothetical protein EDC05_003476 [Coemansia umbellata]KAJ2624936.1 hypothetical protein GGI26_001048 [Coemansia sp. RSA 1358]KAJ2679156.1 hypothetical protein GGI25_001724 [Coemansia spiralis]